MYLHKTKNGHYTPPCCYFSGELEVVESLRNYGRFETLPYYENRMCPVITTFLHGMYYPQNEIFTHIDYTKNQYSADEYQQKYADSID